LIIFKIIIYILNKKIDFFKQKSFIVISSNMKDLDIGKYNIDYFVINSNMYVFLNTIYLDRIKTIQIGENILISSDEFGYNIVKVKIIHKSLNSLTFDQA